MKHIKNELRKKLRKMISVIGQTSREEKSLAISKRLGILLLQKNLIQKEIGGYYPLKLEANYLQGNESSVTCFSLMTKEAELVFKKAEIEDLVKKNVYGQTFLQPRESEVVLEPLVLIIPGLGFGRDGSRIGRGKGYYDKYLKNNKVVKIGICFHEQLVDKVPAGINDIGMDFIVTDKELVEL